MCLKIIFNNWWWWWTTLIYFLFASISGNVPFVGAVMAISTVAGRTESSSQAFADYLLQKWNFGVCGDTLLVLVIDSQYEVSDDSLIGWLIDWFLWLVSIGLMICILCTLQISFSLGGTAEKILEEDFFKKFIHIHGKQFEDKQYAKVNI